MLYFGRWKLLAIIGAIVLGVLYSIPNLVPEEQRYQPNAAGEPVAQGIWGYIPSRAVNLGLDLQGGSHIVFQVDMDEVRERQLASLRDDAMQAMQGDGPRLYRSVTVIGEEVVVLVIREQDRQEAYDRLQSLQRPVQSQPTATSFVQENVLDFASLSDDTPNEIRISITDAQFASIQDRTIAQSIEVVRGRLDGLGTNDPTIARQGQNRVLVQVPGADDPQRIIDLVTSQAVMTFHMVDDRIDPGPNGEARVPPGRQIVRRSPSNGGGFVVIETRELLSGENLTDAGVSQDPNTGLPAVSFRFDPQGSRIFADTTRNFRGRRFAIKLDDEVITDPRINDPILNGSGIITGNFNYETANDLAILLSAGALPASLTPVDRRTISPTLGQDQIESGRIAIIIGFVGVIVFMLAAYGVFGLFSTTALLVNVVLILGALSGLGATLTLPGIAGIILTIGMAVDANVLIFERIREEVRLYKRSPMLAIEGGYQRAGAAILDANVTTLIAALVLIFLGAGPVRGFAITLGIGVVTSVFTAFVFSRLLAVTWLRTVKPTKLPL